MKKLIFILSILFLFQFTYAEENTFLNVKIGKSYKQNYKVELKTDGLFSLDYDENTKTPLNTKALIVVYDGTSINVFKGNTIIVKDFPQKGEILISSDKPIKIGKRSYRGKISFRINNKNLDIINNVEIEDYLKGVVPKELSAEYPLEALKAQAITSRSFAIANINKNKSKGYNLDDTTSCQVYFGFEAEKERSNKAVDETKGMYAMYDGKVANTIFGASSGGRTAEVSEVWGGKQIPYLISFDDSQFSSHPWTVTINKNDLNKKLGKEVYSLSIKDFDSSGRVKSLLINNSDEMKGTKFRNLLGNVKFKSTLFTIEDAGDSFVFKGQGYGHGVGLSQYGAVQMAKQGYKAEEIMKYYFKGVEIIK